jgi:hypothetical protein
VVDVGLRLTPGVDRWVVEVRWMIG